jgi:GTPase involved in cell partitioning and DNA repair
MAIDYQTICQELKDFNKALLEKEEYIILTKTDEVTEHELNELAERAKKLGAHVYALSIYDDRSLKPVEHLLSELSDSKKRRS